MSILNGIKLALEKVFGGEIGSKNRSLKLQQTTDIISVSNEIPDEYKGIYQDVAKDHLDTESAVNLWLQIHLPLMIDCPVIKIHVLYVSKNFAIVGFIPDRRISPKIRKELDPVMAIPLSSELINDSEFMKLFDSLAWYIQDWVEHRERGATSHRYMQHVAWRVENLLDIVWRTVSMDDKEWDLFQNSTKLLCYNPVLSYEWAKGVF